MIELARKIMGWVLKNVLGDDTFARTLLDTRPSTVEEYHKATVRRDTYTRMFYQEVCPGHGGLWRPS